VSRTIRVADGQVWVIRSRVALANSRTPSRRVVAVAGDRVCYSTGSGINRWCSRRAFRIWVRRYHAVQTRTRRPRSMVLRARMAGKATLARQARAAT